MDLLPSSETPEDIHLSTWTPSKELRDSLVDMYKANPRVNVELQQRLPSPARQPLSNTTLQLNSPDRSGRSLSPEHHDWPQAPQQLQDSLTSCSPPPVSHRRSVSPVSPLFQRRSVSPVSPLFQRRSVFPVSPVFQRRSASPVSPPSCRRSVSLLSSRNLRGAGEMDVDLSTNGGPSPQADSCRDTPNEGGASRGPGGPALRRHLVSIGDSPRQVATAQVQSCRDTSILLKELDNLRDANNMLQERLVQKEKELQRRDVEEELREEQREARDWDRAAVLEELLAAQKDRDQALMSRLLLANEERDEALLRTRRLQQADELDSLNLEDSGLDVSDLLQHICDADSGQEVQQFGLVLVQHLRLAQQRRHDITAQEMKAVMEDRDGSVAKSKQLEQDLQLEREQRVSQEELLRLQKERDGALEDRRRLEVEIQVLRANHSSQALPPPPQFLLPGDSISLATVPQALPPEAPPLLVQLQQLSKEKQNVEAELQRCQEAEREASERVHRLERLVEVLRKKVGTGSLRAVV